jgi:hypothetical protein
MMWATSSRRSGPPTSQAAKNGHSIFHDLCIVKNGMSNFSLLSLVSDPLGCPACRRKQPAAGLPQRPRHQPCGERPCRPRPKPSRPRASTIQPRPCRRSKRSLPPTLKRDRRSLDRLFDYCLTTFLRASRNDSGRFQSPLGSQANRATASGSRRCGKLRCAFGAMSQAK